MKPLPDLPLAPRLGECAEALAERGALVLSAEPGSGKTTLMPIGLLEASRGLILLSEPRRLAAVQAASRIASLLGEECGRTVGYAVRGGARRGPATRILAVTDGVLLRMVQEDPALEGVEALVIDEYHERGLGMDLALALCLDARRSLGAGPRILLMSATLDAEASGSFLGRALGAEPALVSVEGRPYPVEIRYRRPEPRAPIEGLAAEAALEALEETGGDVLVFLPGMREIERTRAALEVGLDRGRAEVLVLYGSLPLEEQTRIARGRGPGEKARIVLSTAIAQSSLTVPGVRAVVDAGLSRLSRYDPAAGMDGLVTERVSRRDAEQRAGRAGRTGPGLCLRLWAPGEDMPESTQPEILRADLSSFLLECAVWGADPRDLPLPDAPPEAALSRARELLLALELIDASGRPSEGGRRCAALGAGSRLGKMLLNRRDALAAALAAILSDRDRSGISGDADLRHRLEGLGEVLEGVGTCPAWYRRAAEEARRWMDVLSLAPGARRLEGIHEAGDALASAFPDRIARREGELYRFPGGRTARLAAAKGVHAGSLEGTEWIVAPLVDQGEGVGPIISAAPLSRGFVESSIIPRAAPRAEIEWRGLSPRILPYLGFGRIRLPGRVDPGMDASSFVAASILERLRREGLSILPWRPSSLGLLSRARWACSGHGGARGDFPDPDSLSEEALAHRASEWLIPHCSLPARAKEGFLPELIDEAGLERALAGLLSPFRQALEDLAPAAIVLPSGRSVRIDYAAEGGPAAEGRVQEFYGLRIHPRVAGQALLLRLLSPAGRPVQSTRDLPGFWKGGYAELRKEMRGRYPKHDWPDDPAIARPSERPGRGRR